jgi:ParB/RepB/Spo0J family partition protein
MPDLRVGLVRVDDVQFHPHNVRTDLGDLRSLAQSIANFGVLQPIVVERYGDKLRLRAGHRRLAAAKIIGLTRMPAIIHAEALDQLEWLENAIQENVMRADMDRADRRRAINALRRLGCNWQGIAETFGVTTATIRTWATEEDQPSQPGVVPTKPVAGRAAASGARFRAINRLIATHQDEFDGYLAQERQVGAA